MNPTDNNKDARPSRRPNNGHRSSHHSEMRAVHMRRRVLALGVVAVVGLVGSKLVPAEYRAITGTTTADELQKPFGQVEAKFRAGKFSDGSVREVTLPPVDQSAYQDALALTGSGAPESNIDEVYNDIEVQRGDTPQSLGGDMQVVVPTDDLRPGLQK